MLQGLLMFDNEGRLLVVNHRFCRMFGVPLRQLTVTSYEMPLAPEVLAQEQRMQTAVRAALEREGLLTPDR